MRDEVKSPRVKFRVFYELVGAGHPFHCADDTWTWLPLRPLSLLSHLRGGVQQEKCEGGTNNGAAQKCVQSVAFLSQSLQSWSRRLQHGVCVWCSQAQSAMHSPTIDKLAQFGSALNQRTTRAHNCRPYSSDSIEISFAQAANWTSWMTLPLHNSHIGHSPACSLIFKPRILFRSTAWDAATGMPGSYERDRLSSHVDSQYCIPLNGPRGFC